VKQIISDQCLGLSAGAIDQAAMFADLHLDSLDTVEICIALEYEFGIEVPDEIWEPVKTVQQAIDVVAAALKRQR
jgi:acyl carrier protein